MHTRNTSIDSIKLLASFSVICIHVPISSRIGTYIIAVCRFAVPLFFLISGYYYGFKPSNQAIKRQLTKVGKLCLMSNILFFLWSTALLLKDGNSFFDISSSFFTFKKTLNFIIFGDSPFSPHLWYLSAIAYVYFCFILFNKYNIVRYIFWVTPMLLICDLVFGKYSLALLKHEYSYILVRNFIFVGIPFFSIGYIIKLKQEILLRYFSTNILVMFIVIFIITTITEHYTLKLYSLNSSRDHYISTTFLAITMFLWILKSPGFWFFPTIGRIHSTYIYIFHPIINILVFQASKYLRLDSFYKVTGPIIVFLTTIGVLLVFESFKRNLVKRY